MFRVICVDESCQPLGMDEPKVKKGNIYNVIDVRESKEVRRNGFRHPSGIYYILAECGSSVGYHESLFVRINEQEIDETELVNQKQFANERD